MKSFEQIQYERTVNFTGRNGTFRQIGIDVEQWDLENDEGFVVLTPITSKGETGHCRIEIPIENVNALINILERIAEGEFINK